VITRRVERSHKESFAASLAKMKRKLSQKRGATWLNNHFASGAAMRFIGASARMAGILSAANSVAESMLISVGSVSLKRRNPKPTART